MWSYHFSRATYTCFWRCGDGINALSCVCCVFFVHVYVLTVSMPCFVCKNAVGEGISLRHLRDSNKMACPIHFCDRCSHNQSNMCERDDPTMTDKMRLERSQKKNYDEYCCVKCNDLACKHVCEVDVGGGLVCGRPMTDFHSRLCELHHCMAPGNCKTPVMDGRQYCEACRCARCAKGKIDKTRGNCMDHHPKEWYARHVQAHLDDRAL